jgi:hypothetical protein
MPIFKGFLFAQGIRGIESKLRRTRIDFAALITAEGHRLPQRLRHELRGPLAQAVRHVRRTAASGGGLRAILTTLARDALEMGRPRTKKRLALAE